MQDGEYLDAIRQGRGSTRHTEIDQFCRAAHRLRQFRTVRGTRRYARASRRRLSRMLPQDPRAAARTTGARIRYPPRQRHERAQDVSRFTQQSSTDLLPSSESFRVRICVFQTFLDDFAMPLRDRQVVQRLGNTIPKLTDQFQLLGRRQVIEIRPGQRLSHEQSLKRRCPVAPRQLGLSALTTLQPTACRSSRQSREVRVRPKRVEPTHSQRGTHKASRPTL